MLNVAILATEPPRSPTGAIRFHSASRFYHFVSPRLLRVFIYLNLFYLHTFGVRVACVWRACGVHTRSVHTPGVYVCDETRRAKELERRQYFGINKKKEQRRGNAVENRRICVPLHVLTTPNASALGSHENTARLSPPVFISSSGFINPDCGTCIQESVDKKSKHKN